MEQLLKGVLQHTAETTAPDSKYRLAQDWEHALFHDTRGQLRPSYAFASRTAGQLGSGEVVIEPALGVVRLAAVEHGSIREARAGPLVHLTWVDDYGPCTAAGSYRVDQPFLVRQPSPAEQRWIQQGLDQATWRQQTVAPVVARLIAAHLHFGPRSSLYGFAVDGHLDDQLFDELDQLHANQPRWRSWIQALAGHCVDRDDLGPVPGWRWESDAFDETEPRSARSRDIAQAREPRRQQQSRRLGALTCRQLSGETVVQLMEAAFTLGVAAGQWRHVATAVQRRAPLLPGPGAGE